MNLIENCKNYINQLPCFQNSVENDFQQAISLGDSKQITKLVTQDKSLISKTLPNGESPLTYAILKSQNESIKTLLDNGADVLIFDDQQLNALTAAYFKKDYVTVDLLLEHLIKDASADWKEEYQKNKEALKDSHGLNKFHYAAALRGKEIIKHAKEGVFQLEVQEKDTSIGLARQLDQKSPLAISKYEAAVFACTVALEIGQLYPSGLDPRILQLTNLVHYSSLLQNFDKTSLLVSMLSFAGLNAHLFSERLAPLSAGLNVLLTMNLAYKTLKGLGSCWRNSSISVPQALMKATVSYVPNALLSSKQLRSIGERFGLLAAAPQTPLQSLNERDIKCEKYGFEENKSINYCKDKSLKAYTACVNTPNSEICKEAESSFENFFLFKDRSTYPKCDGNYSHPESVDECDLKVRNWRIQCYDSYDTDSENCQSAYKDFKLAQARNFAPDYNDDFWRNKFKYEKHDCPAENSDDLLNCILQKNTWKKACDTDIKFHSEACKKAETIFRNNLEKKEFSPNYPDNSWRTEAIKAYNCLQEIFDMNIKDFQLDQDTKQECRSKKLDWEINCKLDSQSETCKKAEMAFVKGIKNNFSPDYSSNYWQFEKLKSHNCFHFKNDSNEDCLTKKMIMKQECFDELSSDKCKKALEIFKQGIDQDFNPDYTDNHWRTKELLKPYECKDIQMVDCQRKFDDWQEKCWTDLNSETCANAEKVFKKGREKGFDRNDSLSLWETLEYVRNLVNNYFNKPEWAKRRDNARVNEEWQKERRQENWDYREQTNNAPSQKKICEEAIQKVTGNKVDTLENLKKQRRIKAKLLHPDKNPKGAKAMAELNNAFNIAQDCIKNNKVA